jgi:hypothetical protein
VAFEASARKPPASAFLHRGGIFRAELNAQSFFPRLPEKNQCGDARNHNQAESYD